ncbi:MAG: PAS domain-containing protein [Proteiniphilum sp.]|jgi:DNA-binding CsgD family transcriptional regulator|nr:PAS domain-containing protein [Proteiniphilum sp.]
MKLLENQIVSGADGQISDIAKEVVRTVSIFSEAIDMIFTAHDYTTGTLITVSKAFTRLTGVRQEDIERGNQIYYDVIHPKDLQLLMGVYEKGRELFFRKKKKNSAEFVFTANFRIKTTGDDYIQVDSYSVPVLTDENGYPKIGANILKQSGSRGTNRFSIYYPDSNIELYYSRKLKNFVSERKTKLKDIEIQILRLSADGVNERMISRRLNIKQSLVNHYKRNIFHKLFVNTMPEAVYNALVSKLI